jgi:hypothetical protein
VSGVDLIFVESYAIRFNEKTVTLDLTTSEARQNQNYGLGQEYSARILEEFFNCQLSCLVSNNRSEHYN